LGSNKTSLVDLIQFYYVFLAFCLNLNTNQ